MCGDVIGDGVVVQVGMADRPLESSHSHVDMPSSFCNDLLASADFGREASGETGWEAGEAAVPRASLATLQMMRIASEAIHLAQ